MKKNIVYTSVFIIGLLLGWFISRIPTNKEEEHHHPENVHSEIWTCSMHPQIMQPKAGQCPICGMDLVLSKTGDEILGMDEFKLTKRAMALANIQTHIVGNDDSISSEEQELYLFGKIEKDEMSNEIQTSHFSGRIEDLYVNFVGQEVTKGQLIANVYSPELLAAQQELISIIPLKTSQPELYQAVKNKLKLWKLSDNQISKIEYSGKVKNNFPIYAETTGTVSEMMIRKGDHVNSGQGLFRIDNLNSLWAVFDVSENEIGSIKVGAPLKMTTNAYPDKQFIGSIAFINPTLNKKTRTIKVRADLINNSNLKPGMFIKGAVKSKPRNDSNRLSIPISAILWTGKQSVLYVKTNSKEPIFKMRKVVLGRRIKNRYIILNGLEYGEEIVTNGTFVIDAEAQLKGKKSMIYTENYK